ncbi:MAG TPA: molybdenum cofactor guanylyltransferase MobA [Alphaproteobacteria bacterium]|nr:molybdenum cofactor guanylyltransferase MobA [Alphaproteobacteria bacterium]
MNIVAGVILAGGKSLRMGGGDKSLVMLGDKPLIAHVIERVRPQVADLIINAGGNAERFGDFGLDVLADTIGGRVGPLAGVLTGLEWLAKNQPTAGWLLSVPADTPFLPPDLVRRLTDALIDGKADMACAKSLDRSHPVISIWPSTMAGDLRRAIVDEGVRKVRAWTARYRIAHVEFNAAPVDPFFNVNRPEDLAAAEAGVF